MPQRNEIPFEHIQGWINSTPSTLSVYVTEVNTLSVSLQPLKSFEYESAPMIFSWYWNFGEYINGLKWSIRQEAIMCILQTIGSATRIGITKWTVEVMPAELMHVFSKCWITLMGVGDTGFLTVIFKQRLRDLVLRAWRYAKNYARFEHQRVSQWLASDDMVVTINC